MSIQELHGKEGIKELFLQALNSKVIRTALTGKPLVYEVGEDFAQKYMDTRVKKGVKLQSLRFSKENYDKGDHKDYQKYNKEVKVIDEELESSIIIWNGKVAVVDKDLNIVIFDDPEKVREMNKWYESKWEKAL